MNPAQKETIATAKLAFSALRLALDTSYRIDEMLATAIEEEKSHRGWDFTQYHPNAASVADCAKMFCVLRVAEYLTKKRKLPKGRDFFHTQRSCFFAAALVDEHGKAIRKQWRKSCLDLAYLVAMDYCLMVSPEKKGERIAL